MKFGKDGEILYISPVLDGICPLKVGQKVSAEQVREIAQVLTQALEMAAGLRKPTDLLETLWTAEAGQPWHLEEGNTVISFSGGVADCIQRPLPWLEYGDMGPILGQAIRESRLCAGEYVLGSETIRATVIGAGCHSAQLSGSTVFHRGVEFPLKNIPVREDFGGEETSVIAMEGLNSPGYAQVRAMAREIAATHRAGPVLVCLREDMAKALGQALAMELPENVPILCIDRVRLKPGDYLDVGAPVGPALPVVVKTLVLGST
jgi:ethanolamine utilization protein EutA